MTSGPELEAFLQRWRAALRDRPTFDRTYWEGQKAYSNLKETEFLPRVRLEEEGDDELRIGSGLDFPIAYHAVRAICNEVSCYRQSLNQVRELVESQKAQVDWLDQQAVKFRKRAMAAEHAFAADLRRLTKRIEGTSLVSRRRLEEHWQYPLGLVEPFEGHNMPVQERQLDSRFQVHLGSIFRFFLPRIPDPWDEEIRAKLSLRTIARLIVLFLVCSDLADLRQGQVFLKHDKKRRVTVDGVLQQLRRARLDRPAKAQSKKSEHPSD